MPSVSQAQNAAMHAAAEGHSTLGIPRKVGREFVKADEGRKISKLPEHDAQVIRDKADRVRKERGR